MASLLGKKKKKASVTNRSIPLSFMVSNLLPLDPLACLLTAFKKVPGRNQRHLKPISASKGRAQATCSLEIWRCSGYWYFSACRLCSKWQSFTEKAWKHNAKHGFFADTLLLKMQFFLTEITEDKNQLDSASNEHRAIHNTETWANSCSKTQANRGSGESIQQPASSLCSSALPSKWGNCPTTDGCHVAHQY